MSSAGFRASENFAIRTFIKAFTLWVLSPAASSLSAKCQLASVNSHSWLQFYMFGFSSSCSITVCLSHHHRNNVIIKEQIIKCHRTENFIGIYQVPLRTILKFKLLMQSTWNKPIFLYLTFWLMTNLTLVFCRYFRLSSLSGSISDTEEQSVISLYESAVSAGLSCCLFRSITLPCLSFLSVEFSAKLIGYFVSEHCHHLHHPPTHPFVPAKVLHCWQRCL